MTLDQRIHLTNLLSNPNFIYVCNYCTENGLTPKEVLNKLVHEWRENKEIEPVKSTPNIGGLSDFGESLNNIDARLSQIEGQLADAKSSNTP